MNAEKTYIQQTIFWLLNDNVFLGNLLQELNIRLDNRVPTAALSYDKIDSRFDVLINEKFFEKLNLEERKGVLMHELLHFTHGHIFRFEELGNEKEHALKNIAADMSINQFIKVLPRGCPQCPPKFSGQPCSNDKCPGSCVDHRDWKMQDGTPFPDFQSVEVYFELLKMTTNPPQDDKGEQNAKNEVGPEANWDKYKHYKPFDEHDWAQLSEDEKQRLLQEAKRVVVRATDKAFKDYDNVPDSVKDLLQKIDAHIKKLDYKALLKYAIKKTLTTPDRIGTWYRPNKRYGSYAPGSTYDKAPFINIYEDTSGSISHVELNEFKQVMDGFLRAGSKKCNLILWHTQVYLEKQYKLNSPIKLEEIEAGGTDPACVLRHIEKNRPNLSVILTDGHYGKTNINLSQRIIWVISKDGNMNHPYKDYGLTIKMQGLV